MSSTPGGKSATRKATGKRTAGGAERRQHQRRSILESFGVSAVFPLLGEHRHAIRDLSEDGIGIVLEGGAGAPALVGLSRFKGARSVPLSLYVNRSLCLPLELEIVRIEKPAAGDGAESAPREAFIGARWKNRESEAYGALLGFIQILDKLAASGRIDD